jgi:transcriptional regulator with XRE-family HTH domain
MMMAARARSRAKPRRKASARRTIRDDGPSPTDIHVGSRLRQARLLAGMSQEELGIGIGVSFQAVQKYEHGENRLSASRIYRAACLLERPVAFFFEELGAPLAAGNGGALSREEIELVRCFRLIANESVRDNLLQVAKRIGEAAGVKPAGGKSSVRGAKSRRST